jgi:hypothetical protein
MTTTVLFLCKDLFFWPVVKDAAASISAELVIVRRPDDPKLNELQPGSVACCLIDLASLEVSQIEETIQGLRQKVGDQVRFVAFGPHVQESRLQAAEQAGCSPVLSRGQFQARLPSYLAEWLA